MPLIIDGNSRHDMDPLGNAFDFANSHLAQGLEPDLLSQLRSLSQEAMNDSLVANKELIDYSHTLSENSAEAARQFNKDEAQLARDYNSAEAEKARQFSEMQRATQYQTVVDDLKKAGLNPALAYQNGSAGVTQSASASGMAAHGTAASAHGASVISPFANLLGNVINSASSMVSSIYNADTNLKISTYSNISRNVGNLIDVTASAFDALSRFAFTKDFKVKELPVTTPGLPAP